MRYCTKCNYSNEIDMNFCPLCGAEMTTTREVPVIASEPIAEAPAAPVQPEPQPVVAEPVTPPQPVYTQPVTPPQPTYAQPVTPPQPTYTQPVTPPQPTYTQPVTPPQPTYVQPQQPVYYQGTVAPQNQPSMALKIVSMVLSIVGLIFAAYGSLYTLIGLEEEGMAFGMALAFGLFFSPLSIVGLCLGSKCQSAGDTSVFSRLGKILGLVGLIVAGVNLFIGIIGLGAY